MSSYFNSGHHNWQSNDSPVNHLTTNVKMCSNLSYESQLSEQLNNGYQSYHNPHQASYMMTSAPSGPRYFSPDQHHLHHRSFMESSMSFPHHLSHPHAHHALQHQHHPHPDHVFPGGAVLNNPTGTTPATPVQLTNAFHVVNHQQASVPSNVHQIHGHELSVPNLLHSESLITENVTNNRSTPEQIGIQSSIKHQIYNTQNSVICKFENNSSTASNTARSTTNESPTYDTPPSSTPEINSINSSIDRQEQQNDKSFYPWMKSYTGK